MSTIPGLDPSDDVKGNLEDINDSGSFHQFLIELHEKFGPISSFWYGTHFCVSVANAVTFREVQKLFDRPSEFTFYLLLLFHILTFVLTLTFDFEIEITVTKHG